MDTIKPNFNAIVFAINIDEPPHKWCITECSLAQLVMHHAVDIDTPAGKMPEFFARGNAIWRPSMHGATKIKVFDTENEADYAALMFHFDQMSYTYCMYEPFYYESKAEAAAFIAASILGREAASITNARTTSGNSRCNDSASSRWER